MKFMFFSLSLLALEGISSPFLSVSTQKIYCISFNFHSLAHIESTGNVWNINPHRHHNVEYDVLGCTRLCRYTLWINSEVVLKNGSRLKEIGGN